MYFKYHYNANITPAQLAADLVAIITGTTNPNSLGAGCNKEFSELVANTKATNWTLFDNNTPASPVLRSLNEDGTSYKYVQLLVDAAGTDFKVFESWNSTTHVGLNVAYGRGYMVTNRVPHTTVGTSGSLGIFVTNNFITVAVNSSASLDFSGIFEFQRQTSSLDNTYPCVISMFGGSNLNTESSNEISAIGICRIKNPAAAGDLATYNINGNIHQIINPDGIGGIPFGQTKGALGVDNALHLSIFPMILGYSTDNSLFTLLGTVLGDVLMLPNNTLVYSNLDETTINSKTYIMVRCDPTGYSTLLFPKE